MANPGVGTKFVSVNLNRSYGQPPSSFSNAGASRVRPGSHGSSVGGGMVVLSRPRSSILAPQKIGPKLSVPPPLNLPSLRKEHERFDSSSTGIGSARPGSSGSGSRPTSSGMGWTKPVPSTLQDKDSGGHHPLLGRSGGGAQAVDGGDHPLNSADGGSRASSVYMPPSARSDTVAHPMTGSASSFQLAEKAVVLRGEDFPSLQATLPATPGSAQKQKDTMHPKQKQKQKVSEEAADEQTEGSSSRQLLHMRPQVQSSRHSVGSLSNDNDGMNHGSGGSTRGEQPHKLDDHFPGPLPLVRLNHTSDWADDERDTGHSLPSRDKDHGLSRREAFHDRDFDRPRVGGLPRSNAFDLSDGRGLRDDDVGKVSSKEFLRTDTYGRDVRTPSREGQDGGSWRASSLAKDEYRAREVGIDRNGASARPFTLNRDMNGDKKYNQSPYGDNYRDFSNGAMGTQDSRFGRRDLGYVQGNRQNGNHMMESFSSRWAEQNMRERHSGDISNRYKGDFLRNSLVPKTSFSSGSKGLSVNDPLLDFGREQRSFSNTRKPGHEDSFLKDFGSGLGFDGRDSISGGLVGVFKKKKDVLKQTDFHDPVRESFEAELERVQKMQELERQRIIEEQARALELARKEEEERERLAREEEEQRRRLEEEAREAAWRAEQERLEAVRRAVEQKMAREEEKRRIHMEEERRKEAARQKLLELEARIARRRAEGLKDDKFPASVVAGSLPRAAKEEDASGEAEMGGWEDGERMVERITNSASSDSSSLNRSFGMGSRPHSSRDGNSAFRDRGKVANSWRRDVFENSNSSAFLPQDHENGYRSPRRDAFGAGRAFPRKDVYGCSGVVSARAASKGVAEAYVVDDFPHLRGQRWNLNGDVDHYGRNSEVETEFHDNTAEGFGDMGWGHGRPCVSSHVAYPDGLYQNSEADGFTSYGKSRHSTRQPRVLPPPSLASVQKSSYRGESEWPNSSTFLNSEMRYQHEPGRSEPIMPTEYDGYQERLEQPGIMEAQQENVAPEKNKLDKPATPGCDSQSSLSVSSPPDSPIHLSHDDLDESGDSPVLPAAAEGKEMSLSDSEHVASASEMGNANGITGSNSISPLEDEEWTIEYNEEMQQQEEYDEEEDGYQEEDEVHEGDDENVDLAQEFRDLHLEEKDASGKMNQLVLGFNEGVEVGIPSGDEFERTPKSGENAVQIEQVPVSIAEESGSFDGLVADRQSLQPENYSPSMYVGSSSKTLQEPEKATLQDLVIQPSDADCDRTTSDFFLDTVEGSSSPSLPVQQPVVSSVNMTHPSSVQSVMSTVSSVPSQADGPIKLQFGLFSGPSLIPSPVPAIQIGSIQMPLHLHPQVGPSLSQIHPSQPTFFQFGQLRYPSPLSKGILPLAPQSMSFVQPTIPGHYTLNQNQGGPLLNQAGPDHSSQIPTATVKDKVSFLWMDNQPGFVPKPLDLSQENVGKVMNLPAGESLDNEVLTYQSHAKSSILSEKKPEPDPVSLDQGNHDLSIKKNNRSISNNGESQGELHLESNLSQFLSSERALSASKGPVQMSGGKGKKFIYTVKNSGSKSSVPFTEAAAHSDTSGFQRRSQRNIRRTEFRVRENGDRRQMETVVSSNSGLDGKPNLNGKVSGVSSRSGAKKDAVLAKPSKQSIQSESVHSGSISSRLLDSENKMEKGQGKEASKKRVTSSLVISRSGEGNLKRNSSSEEDVDAPLQSGIVRVFKQSGIEAPSDEDDFIKVRSKRQMLNDRREQREKEIKAKSRVIKAPRKVRSVAQNAVAPNKQNAVTPNNSNKIATSLGEAASNLHSESVVTDGRALPNVEVPAGFTSTVILQPLPPIGTPAVNTDVQADKRSHNIKSLQTSSISVISSGGTSLGLGLPFENKNVVLDNVQTSMAPWGNARINQQVMALTQTQLDEAMNPSRLEAHVASIGDHTSTVIEPSKPSPPILTQDKSYSSAGSPLNSLLAGEKIQFGAVTSPTILPPGSRAISNGILSPGASRSDPIDHNLPAAQSDCTLFFEKEKQPNESCIHLEDPEAEAEAEAAASAVAVAAISSDEMVGNDLGACSVSVSDAKSFGGADIDGLTTGKGVTGDQQLACQSRGEESLTVALPADLSVETPSLSLWPPLPNPQNSSSQMLSHFPGATPSHFPCYEINPMLGGPIFAFGPHDESAGTQSQSQKSSTPASGTLGGWQQCHSGLDSFYGPPAGFTGPFISPPGGIPGVQAPPHMVVYNHFAPVGQFGQVGLSFMGTTYIPSGKQPDWKHNPTSSAMGIGEGDINNLNMVSAQRNTPSMPAPVQHLAPGSPLLPMASPLAMFDMSPFQSSADIPVQARWSHIPASPMHSIPLSMPLQQQADGLLTSQFSHGLSGDQTSTVNKIHDTHTSASSDNNRIFPVAGDATDTQLPYELGLVSPSSCTTIHVSAGRPASNSLLGTSGNTQNVVTNSSAKNAITNASESGGGIHNNMGTGSSQSMTSAFKVQSSQRQNSTQQYLHPTGYVDQRTGGISQKTNSGGEWSHRRMGFQGRTQLSGTDKNFASKMKQIYVAKPASSGASGAV
ncbi:uncharacterized protein LOC122069995 isoform X2 [Macadamia integrifolia]|uniref:uncharacterized protein LOC122069995 isoform X2 n=1 Tax=Macadamia integrifolia TaxID=60698 RepID=UPI001C4EF367|nr:uncharacterized protein LOC122069995 isoform X2 [Macadamia integrifolia]